MIFFWHNPSRFGYGVYYGIGGAFVWPSIGAAAAPQDNRDVYFINITQDTVLLSP